MLFSTARPTNTSAVVDAGAIGITKTFKGVAIRSMGVGRPTPWQVTLERFRKVG